MVTPLGYILVAQGDITQNQLQHALEIQQTTGDRLGDILVSEGMLGYWSLYKSVAQHYRLPFINLIDEPPDPSLFDKIDRQLCLKFRAVPWRKDGDDIIIATSEYSEALKSWVAAHFGTQVRFAITSPFDIQRAVAAHYHEELESHSLEYLWRKNPLASARRKMATMWRNSSWVILAVLIFLAWMYPISWLVAVLVVCHVAYAISSLFKLIVFTSGRLIFSRRAKPLEDAQLPLYTIMVPMYKEAQSVIPLLRTISQLDYPAAKLDIKLVLEADDQETIAAVYAARPPSHIEIIRVPPSEPRTKPKALNYALQFARGDIVAIYDADDRPEPQQLRKAAAALIGSPKDVVCVQARLNYYNSNENWLTRYFSLEYTMLFRFMLAGFQALGIPIPLGGTSNHIMRSALQELGEWDPYNVTEDADLGIRIAARGWRTRMINSFTMEEAPTHVAPWIRQRSRWIKGYMQTWLVYMRRPLFMLNRLRLKGFVGVQCIFGLSCFIFLTAPLVWGITLASMMGYISVRGQNLPDWLLAVGMVNLAFYIVTHWYFTLYCAIAYRESRLKMAFAGLTYPIYLILHSFASYKSLWQLFYRPHFWEKTMHGRALRQDCHAVEAHAGLLLLPEHKKIAIDTRANGRL